MTVTRLLVPLLILAPIASAGATGNKAGASSTMAPPAVINSTASRAASEAAPSAKAEPTAGSSNTAIKDGETESKPTDPLKKPNDSKGSVETAKAAAPAKPSPPKVVVEARVDLTRQRMTVKVDGVPKYAWTVSSGATGYETPNGTFRGQRMHEMWYSRKYDDAPMPHSVFFHGGYAIHATYSTSSLGRPMSHGCVRLSPANARIFFNLVKRHGLRATKVVVTGNTPYNPPPVASRGSSRRGYGNSPFESSRGFSAAPPRVIYRDYPPTGARRLRWPGDAPSAGWGWTSGNNGRQRGAGTSYYRVR